MLSSLTDAATVSQTYQALRGALAEFHTDFLQYLAGVEQTVLKQGANKSMFVH